MANCLFCKKFEKCLYRIDREFSCRDYQMRPITNADRIRAKSDDEMASWLALHPCLPNCPAQTDECFKSSKLENCKKQWLDWLKEKAEGET